MVAKPKTTEDQIPLKLFNTRTQKKEEFVPITKGKVGLYTCGPTVYYFAHIGNLRSYINWDILRRVLEFNSLKVNHVMNITDVGHLTSDADSGEDKMLKGARREKKTVWEVAEFYTKAFKDDISKLNIEDPTVWCKATDHIKEQIEMIKSLEKNDLTYQKGGNVYFDTSKFARYADLARIDMKKEGQARVEQDKNKKNNHDFVLWFTKSKFQDQEMKWKSPWGEGYPGWHIECSAMATKYLGKQFDIHTGGIDHIPVHHTNEIAQAEGALGVHPWANFWLHSEFLVVGKDEKMAKSGENFLTINVLEKKGFTALDHRYFCLSAQYRKPLQFSFDALENAKISRRKLQEKVWELQETVKKPEFATKEQYSSRFLGAINDDLNMPKALAVVWDILKSSSLKDAEKLALVLKFDEVLGLKLDQQKPILKVPKGVTMLAQEREKARKTKEWAKADELREKINKLGFEIADTPAGFEIMLKEK